MNRVERMKKNPFLSEVSSLIGQRYPEDCDAVLVSAWVRFEALCAENADETTAVQMHTRSRIYPAIAVFESLIAVGTSREDAAQLILDFYMTRAQKASKSDSKPSKGPRIIQSGTENLPDWCQ